jgi:hypothetical protein
MVQLNLVQAAAFTVPLHIVFCQHDSVGCGHVAGWGNFDKMSGTWQVCVILHVPSLQLHSCLMLLLAQWLHHS